MPSSAGHVERLRASLITALRALRATPVLTGAAVALLSVAAGLNLAMFGLIDRAVLSPARHVADPSRVFTLGFEIPDTPGRTGAPGRMTTTSYVTFASLRTNVTAFADSAAWRRTTMTAIVAGEQIRPDVMLVSGAYFGMLGVPPAHGRGLTDEDERGLGGLPGAVLSDAFWRSTFGGDFAAIGRTLSIGGIEYVIAGIMPDGFNGHSATRVDVWVPMAAAMRETPGWDRDPFRNVLAIVVRLAPASTAAAAAEQASAVLERRVALLPIAGGEIAQTERRIAYALMGVSVLVLIIGLANTATLLLIRAGRRRRDFAIRAALGASRARLAAEVTVEAALLAAVSTIGALVLSYWFDEGVRSVLLSSLSAREAMNARGVLAALATGCLTLALVATVGFAQRRQRLTTQDLTGAGPDGRRRSRAHPPLLVLQTALAVVLVVGAGLFARSLHNLVRQDFGMKLDGVMLIDFERGAGHPDTGAVLEAAVERIQRLPGVERATPVQMIPFTGFHVLPIAIPGLADPPNAGGQLPYLLAAAPELFDVLGLEMVQGRRFTAADEKGAPVVIVNESLARAAWPGVNAVGRCMRIGFDESFDPMTSSGPPGPPAIVPCREVIGVARDVRQRSVVPTGNEERLLQYYVPFTQVPPPPGRIEAGPRVQGILARTSVDPSTLIAPMRRAVLEGRTDLPFVQVRPYMQLLERQMQPWQMGTRLLAMFGALALAVSVMGVYAAFAHAVADRRREMAIRTALGAAPSTLVAMVLREAAVIAAVGAVCGCIAAAFLGSSLRAMLFATAPTDPLVMGASAVLAVVLSVAATMPSARAASGADPATLLRIE